MLGHPSVVMREFGVSHIRITTLKGVYADMQEFRKPSSMST